MCFFYDIAIVDPLVYQIHMAFSYCFAHVFVTM